MSKYVNGFILPQQVATYQLTEPLLDSLYSEFSELSKKKPQDVLSAGKVRVVNRILAPILDMLADEPVHPFLEILDDNDLPQNSDVILMLGQFKAGVASFRKRHWDGRDGWHVDKPDDSK